VRANFPRWMHGQEGSSCHRRWGTGSGVWKKSPLGLIAMELGGRKVLHGLGDVGQGIVPVNAELTVPLGWVHGVTARSLRDRGRMWGIQVRRSALIRTRTPGFSRSFSSLSYRSTKSNAFDEEPEDEYGLTDEAEPRNLQVVAGDQHGTNVID